MSTRWCPFERARFPLDQFEEKFELLIHKGTEPLHEAIQGQVIDERKEPWVVKLPPVWNVAAMRERRRK